MPIMTVGDLLDAIRALGLVESDTLSAHPIGDEMEIYGTNLRIEAIALRSPTIFDGRRRGELVVSLFSGDLDEPNTPPEVGLAAMRRWDPLAKFADGSGIISRQSTGHHREIDPSETIRPSIDAPLTNRTTDPTGNTPRG